MRLILLIVFLFGVCIVHSKAQTDFYLYGCENCTLTELIPFGDYKIVSYLEKRNSNKSRLMLLDKQNLGIDTLTGWLEGYRRIIKTEENSFTSIGNSSLDFSIQDGKIVIDRSIGMRYFFDVKENGMSIDDPIFFWDNWVITPFFQKKESSKKGKNKEGSKLFERQFFALPTKDLRSNPDITSSRKDFYGGRVPVESNFIIDGKEKNPWWKFHPITEKVIYEDIPYRNVTYAVNGGQLLMLERMNNTLYLLSQTTEQVHAKQIKLGVDTNKFRFWEVFSDLKFKRDYLLVWNIPEKHYEIWELDISRASYKALGKTPHYPYHIEDGHYFVKLETDKRVDILRLPIY
ncbi:MAG: hypothetical protein ACXIUD_08895 [Mongoliitalea sp.]